MKKIDFVLISIFCTLFTPMYGQLTIDECYKKAQINYPLVKQYGLIKQSEEYNLQNASKGYLPQFSLSAKASYQSDVTELPIRIPNTDIKGVTKDQYQAVVEVNQSVWDGGIIRSQRKISKANAAVEKQKLEVELYTINDRVNQLYFGILLLDEQLKQNDYLQKELKRNFDQVSSYVSNGIANQADLDAVRVNQLNTNQRMAELTNTRKAYKEMLSALIGETINENSLLVRPAITEGIALSDSINRPEMRLYDVQKQLFESQKELIKNRNMPKIGLFVQGGYGNPALNMLKSEFSPYYIAGARLSWNFSGLYTHKNERKLLETSQQSINVQQETFLFNTRLKLTQLNNEIYKMQQLMRDDDEIIKLRSNIKQSAEIKVKNGALSVTELLREINSEDMAKQNKALHEIQLLMTIYNYKNTTNN